MPILNAVRRIFERSDERPFMPSPLATLGFAFKHRANNALVGRGFRLRGDGDLIIQRNARLRFGTRFFGFMDGTEKGLIRNRGRLQFEGDFSIGAGSRWDIGPEAVVCIGAGTYFSPNTLVVADHRVVIGAK